MNGLVALRRLAPLRSRIGSEQGFGLVELVFAVVLLSVGVLAMIGAFVTGAASLRSAAATRAAGALANQQMELYRSTRYCQIALTGDASGQLAAAPASPYQLDVAYSPTQVTTALSNSWCTSQSPAQTPPYSACLSSLGSSPSPALNSCSPSQTVRGPDRRPYRVDTYVVLATGGSATTFSGREVKQVTVVVRDGSTLKVLAREASTFDASTGS